MNDDYYFDNKNKKRKPSDFSDSRRTVSDEFLDVDYFDENFNLNFKKKEQGQAFSGSYGSDSVNGDEVFSQRQAPQNRTPGGRPLSENEAFSASGDTYFRAANKTSNPDERGRQATAHYDYGNSESHNASFNSDADSNGRGYGNFAQSNPTSQRNMREMGKESESNRNLYQKKAPSAAPQTRSVQARASQQRTTQQGAASRQRSPQSRTPQGPRVEGRNGKSKPVVNYGGKGKGKASGFSPKALVIGIVVLIFAAVLALFAYGYHALGGLDYDDSVVENAYVDESTLASSKDVTNILLLGCDGREDVSGDRSDTMILMSIDKQNKKIKLTSFLRDSYVYIPSKGYNTKLNASFAYGGAQLVMDTLEYNFGVNIDHYLMVDFTAFKTLVNMLGGITVEGVTEAEAKYLLEEVKIKSQEIVVGTNEFSGNTALWYCRIRYLDNDFKRTERQRKVISAIISKAMKTNIFTLLKTVEAVVPHISTDMTRNQLLGVGISSFTKLLSYDIVQQQIPASGTWSDAWASGQQVLKMDIEENATILKSFIYDKDSDKKAE